MMPTNSDDDLMCWLTNQLDYHVDVKQQPVPPPPPPQPPPPEPSVAFPRERLAGGGGPVSYPEAGADASMNTEEHVVSVWDEQGLITCLRVWYTENERK